MHEWIDLSHSETSEVLDCVHLTVAGHCVRCLTTISGNRKTMLSRCVVLYSF